MAMNNHTPINDIIKKYHEMRYAAHSPAKEFDIPAPIIEKNQEELSPEVEPSLQEQTPYITPQPKSIKLPPELKKLGIQTPDTNEQFKSALYKIKLPISDEKIMADLKASPAESKRWYATILLYALQMAHLSLRRVGSKVVRVFKTG